jgi:hypothetical protein
MGKERVVYSEWTHWPQWVHFIYWGSVIAWAYPLLTGWGSDDPFAQRLITAVAILAIYVVAVLLLGGLTVVVRTSEVLVHLGAVPLIKKRVPFGDIVSLESVRYHPIRDVGGWGVRGFGAKQVWSARGDQAVVLHLVSGKQLYVGSDTPNRLEERIRTSAGDRLGQNA